MTTKDQERKALEQIKNIVLSLGEDSYIGTAFEGCFEIAEENIENDWACSMLDRAESAERNIEAARKKYEELTAKLKTEQDYNDRLNAQCDKQNAEIERLKEDVAAAKLDHGMAMIDNVQKDDEIKKLKDDVIHLKAKLYDLMVKEGK